MENGEYTVARYYAISGIGYGWGASAGEAEENYYAEQVRNFAHLGRTKAARRAKIKEIAPPAVFEAPTGAIGFTLDVAARWSMRSADGSLYTEPATDEQVVKVAGSGD